MLSGLPCCQPLPCFAAPTALPLAPAPSLGDSTLLPGALLWGQPLGPRAPDLLQVPRACCKWGDPSHDVPCRTPLHLFLFVMLLSLPGGALAFPRPTSPHPPCRTASGPAGLTGTRPRRPRPALPPACPVACVDSGGAHMGPATAASAWPRGRASPGVPRGLMRTSASAGRGGAPRARAGSPSAPCPVPSSALQTGCGLRRRRPQEWSVFAPLHVTRNCTRVTPEGQAATGYVVRKACREHATRLCHTARQGGWRSSPRVWQGRWAWDADRRGLGASLGSLLGQLSGCSHRTAGPWASLVGWAPWRALEGVMAPAPPFPRLQRGPARPAGVLGAEWVSVLGTWRPLSRTAAPLLWQRVQAPTVRSQGGHGEGGSSPSAVV